MLTKNSANEAINMGIRDAVSFGPFLIVNGDVLAFAIVRGTPAGTNVLFTLTVTFGLIFTIS